MSTMSQRGLEQFGAYEKARVLFDVAVADMQNLNPTPETFPSLRNKNRSAPES
jgi:hypothetical protein